MIRRSVGFAICCVALLVALGAGAGLAGTGIPSSAIAAEQPGTTIGAVDGQHVTTASSNTMAGNDLVTQEPDEFDRTVFRIEVFESGNARWTTEYSRPLADSEERDQFEAFADQFEAEETELFEGFGDRAEALTDSASDITERSMTASAFEREAFVDQRGQERGVVRMSFEWSNFALDEGNRLVVGDVFGGGWAIDTDQHLEIRAGDGLEMDSVADADTIDAGSIEENSVTWFGERQFAHNRPRVEFVSTNVTTPPTNGQDNDDEDAEDDTHEDDPADEDTEATGIGMTTVMILLALVLVAGLGLAWYAGIIGREGPTEAEGTAEASTGEQSEAVAIEEPVSDEDQVLQLLEQNGGRMKQVTIVDETNWSKSKVSMLLSEMEEEDLISKLRVGRENIISLEGQEPDAAGSPFEDE